MPPTNPAGGNQLAYPAAEEAVSKPFRDPKFKPQQIVLYDDNLAIVVAFYPSADAYVIKSLDDTRTPMYYQAKEEQLTAASVYFDHREIIVRRVGRNTGDGSVVRFEASVKPDPGLVAVPQGSGEFQEDQDLGPVWAIYAGNTPNIDEVGFDRLAWDLAQTQA
ncbi:hypothetical protein BJX99DRAFT_220106 [Aspergillus californicus]